MKQVLPIIVICGVGLTICAVLLVVIVVRSLKKSRFFRRKKEEFELDEHTITVRLDKKDLRK